MANSDISVPSVDLRQEPSLFTTFSIYGLAAVSITYLRSILAPILAHQMDHVSKIDRRTTKYGARFRITVPEDRQRNIIQRLERQSKQTHWRIRQNYRHRRPDQSRPTAPPPPLSRQILAVNVANISNKRPAIRHIVRNTRLWAISETCITSSKFRFTVPGFDVIQHPATGPGRRGIALGIPSCFGGHEHGSAVGTMILAKVPNFTPECLTRTPYLAKCGIISFTGHLAPRLDNPLDIRLHGQLVSRVESYKYLGVLIDPKLDHSAWLKQKRSALEHTISALHPVLANHQLTVNYRSRIFSAVVMGKAYYGLELVGGNKSHLAPL
ncbi:hypothetical protein BASA81_018603 [Batrachochytrium salamandrivorans]|nr:hypothetical protein BASA81_018603 [Batrachochytrium salamandrivorans]